jgi:hypothetical protein
MPEPYSLADELIREIDGRFRDQIEAIPLTPGRTRIFQFQVTLTDRARRRISMWMAEIRGEAA